MPTTRRTRRTGLCARCGEPVQHKTKGGNWYLLCDDHRKVFTTDASHAEDAGPRLEDDLDAPPPFDERVQELEREALVADAEQALAEARAPRPKPEGYGPGTATRENVHRESKSLGRGGNPVHSDDPTKPPNELLGPTGFDEPF